MILHGDCLDKLKELESNSIDSIVTDPPYGLKFMGKKWDYEVPKKEIWEEALRVLKPGGHLLSFSGTRTYHRMVINIEDAGFEIRDQLAWIFGSGFPKSHNLKGEHQGFGTALKPAQEPICLARKPLVGTVASNVQEFGTGAINIDASRIGLETIRTCAKKQMYGTGESNNGKPYIIDNRDIPETTHQGRWPANILLDESAAELLDEQSGDCKTGLRKSHYKNDTPTGNGSTHGLMSGLSTDRGLGGSGVASRFFYCAKSSKRERNAGLEGLEGLECLKFNEKSPPNINQNFHPTVKPIKLMEYLVRMITPPNGVCLDPFMGSGSTGVAAKNLGFKFIGIEREAEYVAIAEKRIG